MRMHFSVLLAGLLAAGCAAAPQHYLPPPLVLPQAPTPGGALPLVNDVAVPLATRVSETPKPPLAEKTQAGKVPPPVPVSPAAEKAEIALDFESIPLPTFVQAVYSTILKQNVSIDPAVMARKDLVTFRTGGPQTPSQTEEAMRMLLKSYGLAALHIGGVTRIVPDDKQLGYLPEIRRGRALPETPMPMRPVFRLVELQSVRNTEVANWIKVMFEKKVTVQEDAARNALLLSGSSDNVMAAIEAIQVLDQPLMKGRKSARIEPLYWQAEEFAKKLAEVLQAEGYGANTALSLTYPITVLPVQAINAVIVFAADQTILDHVIDWGRNLDSPRAAGKGGEGYFTYKVRHVDAVELAKTIEQVMAAAPVAAVAADAKAAPAAAQPRRSNRVVVDDASNQLVFQGAADEYGRILGLLQELDQPVKSALIEVTVAEVALTDRTKLGVEWAFRSSAGDGGAITGGTVGGLGIGTGGLTVRALNSLGDVRLLLNALATNDQTRILSTPRIMARSGETATIQVGDEVPILTSQQTSPTTGGNGSILQSIQYRNTGIVLKVKPVIHSGDRVDLDIAQEVSNPVSTTTGVSNSPTISTRKIETKLSLRDGSTILLGGLIRENVTKGRSGIPLLKDIPFIGQAFRTDSDENVKTELLILITPYVVEDDHDARAVTEAFRNRLNGWAKASSAAGTATE